MSAVTDAHTILVNMLTGPSFLWGATYDTHTKAKLLLPSISIEPEVSTPIDTDKGISESEFFDNWKMRFSIRVHTNYRLGPLRPLTNMQIVDAVIRELRENLLPSPTFYIYEVVGTTFNVEHASSGTTGAEIQVDIHKVEFYAQS